MILQKNIRDKKKTKIWLYKKHRLYYNKPEILHFKKSGYVIL